MHRLALGLVVAFALASSAAGALAFSGSSPSKLFSRADFCPLVLASTKTRVAQMPCRQTGGTRAAPVCGGSCDYSICNVQRDAQNRPFCGC